MRLDLEKEKLKMAKSMYFLKKFCSFTSNFMMLFLCRHGRIVNIILRRKLPSLYGISLVQEEVLQAVVREIMLKEEL